MYGVAVGVVVCGRGVHARGQSFLPSLLPAVASKVPGSPVEETPTRVSALSNFVILGKAAETYSGEGLFIGEQLHIGPRSDTLGIAPRHAVGHRRRNNAGLPVFVSHFFPNLM